MCTLQEKLPTSIEDTYDVDNTVSAFSITCTFLLQPAPMFAVSEDSTVLVKHTPRLLGVKGDYML